MKNCWIGDNNIDHFNQKMEDIMIIVKCLERTCLLVKGVREALENEVKEQKKWIS